MNHLSLETSWAVYGSANTSVNVHLFILTGTISCEGVYCRLLFLCILAVASFLCCAVMLGLQSLSFWAPHF